MYTTQNVNRTLNRSNRSSRSALTSTTKSSAEGVLKKAVRATLLSLLGAGALLGAQGTASAAETKVGTGTIHQIRHYSDQHGFGEAIVVEMRGTYTCNAKSGFAVSLDGHNEHFYAALTAAFLADKPVALAVEPDVLVGGRCTIVAFTVG